MVEKMSGSIGGTNRASNAILKRRQAINEWPSTETGKQPSVRHPHQFTINFDKGTVFLSAVASGDIKETEKLLKEGVDIDYTNVDGLTALHQACIDENEEMVQLLIEKGADIEARDNEGWTPLHAAASAGNVEIAQILIDNKASCMAVNNEGEVPLDLVEDDEMEEFLEEVIEDQNLDLEQARQEEEDAMLDDAKNWLDMKRIENEQLDWQGATALHVAAAKNYEEVIKLLVQIKSLDINTPDEDGWTALHAAIHWSHKESCELLAEAGADFNIRNNNGNTPCDVADPDFIKFAENLRKKYSTKNESRDRQEEIANKEFIASVTKKEPKMSAVKGGRDAYKSSNNNSSNSKPSVSNKKEAKRPSSFVAQSVSISATKAAISTVASKPSVSTSSISSSSKTRNREKSSEGRSFEPVSITTSISNDRDSYAKDVPTTKSDRESRASSSFSSASYSRSHSTNNDANVIKVSSVTTSSVTTSSVGGSDWKSMLSKRTQDHLLNDSSSYSYSSNKPTDENETNENDSSSASSHNSDSRIRISDRFKKQNEDIIRQTTNNNKPSSASYSSRDTSRDTSSTTSLRSSYAKPGTRTSTSTSDTGDTKDVQRKLEQALQDADEYKQKYERMKKEKEDLQKKLEQYKEDIDKMQELKTDNLRLKDENGALIRVISKLSRTPSSS